MTRELVERARARNGADRDEMMDLIEELAAALDDDDRVLSTQAVAIPGLIAELEHLRAVAPRPISTVEELVALPLNSVVVTADGTVACHLGEDRYAAVDLHRVHTPWSALTLPALAVVRPGVTRR